MRREPQIREIALWLLQYLDTDPPRYARDVQQEAESRGYPIGRLRIAASQLPLLRRSTVVRGPWVWGLPSPEELVQVRYHCPIVDCDKTAEGWMEFEISRSLFTAGLLEYLTRGRLRRTLPGTAISSFLRLAPPASK